MGFDSTLYKQCLLLSLVHNEFLKETKHPAYTQMINNIRSHNEERGEMSLSQLAFSLVGDSDVGSVDKLDLHYTLLNFCHTLVKEYSTELYVKHEKDHTLSITKNREEVQRITQFMKSTITAMSDDTYTSYEPHRSKYQFDDPRDYHFFVRILPKNPSYDIMVELQNIKTLLLQDNFSYSTCIGILNHAAGPQQIPRPPPPPPDTNSDDEWIEDPEHIIDMSMFT